MAALSSLLSPRRLLSVGLLALALPSAAHAGVVSVKGVLNELSGRVLKMEENNIQVTDVTLGVLTPNNVYSLPLQLAQGEKVVLLGVGDSSRITNLDLVVVDQRGHEVARDEEKDNVPVVIFTPEYSGTFIVTVVASEMQPSVSDGFFAISRGRLINQSPVTITDTLLAAAKAAELVEAKGYQIEYAQWVTIAKKQSVQTTVELTGGEDYMLVGVGSPDRMKNLDMLAVDASGAIVGEDHQKDAVPIIPVKTEKNGIYTLQLQAVKMNGKAKDAHALVLAARGPKE